jgi:hypothetical protein
MKLELSRQILEKSSNIKLHSNPSSGVRAVTCGRTDTQADGRKNVTGFTVTFREFVHAPQKEDQPGLPGESVRTAQQIHSLSIKKAKRLTL